MAASSGLSPSTRLDRSAGRLETSENVSPVENCHPGHHQIDHDNHVRKEGEGAEDQVSVPAKPRLNNLQESLGSRSSHLQHDGED